MKIKRVVALALVVIFAMSCFSVAVAENPWDGMVATSVLEKVVSTSDCVTSDGFDGYIQTVRDSAYLSSDYIKVTYTVTGTVTDETNIFTIQPFNSEWGGWDDNFITIGNSILDNGVYTAYVAVTDIKNSLSSGAFMGINISFVENSGYEATITGYDYLAPEAEEMTERKWLKRSIDYCEALNPSKYQPASWNTFLSAIDTAKGVYENETATDKTYKTARNDLEKAKAKLLFVDSDDPGNPLEFRVLSGTDTVYEMGVGWNLGNTMDGHTGFHPSETAWQSAVTTREMIKAIHDAGFNTIRVPVTWGDMIDDENGYAINDAWINRVQDIVDYCTEMDMYTIINVHHDGAEQDGWLRVAADDIDAVYEKFECVWRNIAEKFKDYDEHLIFESANELTCMEGDDKNSAAAQEYDTPIIMNLNQIFVNVVRSTGSNNTKRWLASVSHYANRGTSYGFALPTDSYNSSNRLMFAQHIYKKTNQDTYTWTDAKDLVDVVNQSYKKFKNIPIILGEYGTKNRKYTSNPSGFNDIGRAYYFECATRAGQVGNTVPCVWDQGCNTSDIYETGTYTIWNRNENKPLFKSITDAMMRGMYLPATSKNKSFDMSDIASNPTVTEITEITPDSTEVVIEYGGSVTVSTSVAPSNSNDVVLWKSADDSIATVTRGIIQGNKIGTTTVTAFSQSGSTETQIKVTVLPKTSENPVTAINTDSESYSVVKGKYVQMNVSAEPSNSGDALIYSSSNPQIATVNRLGKIVGISEGTAYITVTASSGLTKTVPVTVKTAEKEDKLEIAANVYYNDSKYAANEVGVPITVTGDGQYTLTFDTTTDLSDKAKAAGISYLNNLTSIYIKDNDVTNGNAAKSPLDSCNIRYDSITVDGTPLTITNTGFKSAIKESGIFDTNDPINGWDGSAVKEVITSNHTVNFTTVTNPTRIEIVFTLENMKFTEDVPADVIPATSINASSKKEIRLAAGDSARLTVDAAPVNTTSLVAFISSNQSVAMVNDRAISVSDGSASALIKAVGMGTAEITAITDNGLSETFTVTVSDLPFANVETVNEGGVITTVTADVNYLPEGAFMVIAAVYDSEGAVKDYETKTVDVSSVTDSNLNISGFNLAIGEGDTARAYIWDNAENMSPLSK